MGTNSCLLKARIILNIITGKFATGELFSLNKRNIKYAFPKYFSKNFEYFLVTENFLFLMFHYAKRFFFPVTCNMQLEVTFHALLSLQKKLKHLLLTHVI